MTEAIEALRLSFQKRYGVARAGISSEDYNDNMDEIAHDLISLSEQWNSRLVSLISTLPNEDGTDEMDAWEDGLSGKTIYANPDATQSIDTDYYNSIYTRPNSLYEQLSDIYTALDTVETTLSSQISAIAPIAAGITIADTASLYYASNVESALAEVMNKVNLVTLGSLDLSAVAQHYLPQTTNTYDVGSSSKKVRDVYIGNVVHFGTLSAAEIALLSPANGDMVYNTTTNKFQGYASGSWVDLH